MSVTSITNTVDAFDEYVDAVYELSKVICQGDAQLLEIEQKCIRDEMSIEEATELSMFRKADLIRMFTQKWLRGGFN